MRHRQPVVWAALAAAGLALCLAAPAEAAKRGQDAKAKPHVRGHSRRRHRRAAVAAHRATYQGGVPQGPLYNGQDYLGDDPDPNIRSQILRDMGRYGGVD